MESKHQITNKLKAVWDAIVNVEKEHAELLTGIHTNYQYNALNFLRYLKFRTFDLTEIQADLTALGISSLSHAERHVLANIENILYLLSGHLGIPFQGNYPFGEHPIHYKESFIKLRENSLRLFGNHIQKQAVMVTLPSDGDNVDFLAQLLESGMNIARINCSHDNIAIWTSMIEKLREAEKRTEISCSVYMDLAGPKIRTHNIYTKTLTKTASKIHLFNNDRILILNEINDNVINDKYKAIVTCTLPEIINDTNEGDPILFDDGKIEGIVEEKNNYGLVVRILETGPNGIKLKPEKGINLPETHLNLPALTAEDISNLDFICQNADLVGFSFVRHPEDVSLLQNELKKRQRADIGMVLKIENNEAFENLPALLLQAMQSPNIGVMTARGDLAVELGVVRLSEVQEEIMWFCEAALIPNIWATQVLETMAKKGIASRAEVTDAAMSVRTECIMLNKGPYIVKALKTLSAILERMEKHQSKKHGSLRRLQVASKFWEQQA